MMRLRCDVNDLQSMSERKCSPVHVGASCFSMYAAPTEPRTVVFLRVCRSDRATYALTGDKRCQQTNRRQSNGVTAVSQRQHALSCLLQGKNSPISASNGACACGVFEFRVSGWLSLSNGEQRIRVAVKDISCIFRKCWSQFPSFCMHAARCADMQCPSRRRVCTHLRGQWELHKFDCR